jgi:CBS domain-containing protein
MVEGHRGCVLIAREGLLKEVEGIVATGEIFRKVLVKGLDPATVKVSEIMTPAPLITVNPKATTKEAATLMRVHRIRRLPVVEGGTLVGIVTTKDLMVCVE